MRAKIFQDLTPRLLYANGAIFFQKPLARVQSGQSNAFEKDVVVIFGKRFVLQVLLRLIDRFDRIAGQQALIDKLRRTERRLVAQLDLEKFQSVNVPPQNDKTDRQRGRQYQSDRTPQ